MLRVRLRKGLRWLRAGLLGSLVATAGCHGHKIAVPHHTAEFVDDTHVLLRRAHFDDSGPNAHVASSSATIYYDLASNRQLWSLNSTNFRVVSIAPGGAYGLALEFEEHEGRGRRVQIMDFKRGAMIPSQVWLNEGVSAPEQVKYAARSAHVSADGRYVAAYVGGALQVFNVNDGQTLYRQPMAVLGDFRVRIAPSSPDVFMEYTDPDRRVPTVALLAHTGEGWQLQKPIAGSRAAWSERGLLLLTGQGAGRYDGKSFQVLIAEAKETPPTNTDYFRPDAVFSEDGRYLAHRRGGRWHFYDLQQQRLICEGEGAFQVSFRGPLVFTYGGGELYRYDLSTGEGKRLKSFGDESSSHVVPFVEFGRGVNVHYKFTLGPGGRYALQFEDKESTAYQLSEL